MYRSKASPSPPAYPWNSKPCPRSREFDVQGLLTGREFDGRVGNLNRKSGICTFSGGMLYAG